MWNHFTCKCGDTLPTSLLRRWPYTYIQLLRPEWQVEIVILISKFHPTTAGSTNEINGHPKLFRQDHIGKVQHSTSVPESRRKITCIRSPAYRVQLTFHYIWRNWRCNQIGYSSVTLQSWCQHKIFITQCPFAKNVATKSNPPELSLARLSVVYGVSRPVYMGILGCTAAASLVEKYISRMQNTICLLCSGTTPQATCSCLEGDQFLSFLLPVKEPPLCSARLCSHPWDASVGDTSWTTPFAAGASWGCLQCPVLSIQSQILALSSPDFSSIGTCQDPISDSYDEDYIRNNR